MSIKLYKLAVAAVKEVEIPADEIAVCTGRVYGREIYGAFWMQISVESSG